MKAPVLAFRKMVPVPNHLKTGPTATQLPHADVKRIGRMAAQLVRIARLDRETFQLIEDLIDAMDRRVSDPLEGA